MTHTKGKGEARRGFMRTLLAGGAALATLSVSSDAPAQSSTTTDRARVRDAPDAFVDGNIRERMRQDLRRALDKPLQERRWGMVIDLQKCIGCSACRVACTAENNLPPGVVYRPVIAEEIGTFPNVRKRFLPRPCMQCEEPPCVPVCPVGATYIRLDGVVAIDYDACIGCRYCIVACPYGARSFDFGEFYTTDTPQLMDYESRPNYEYGKTWKRDPETADESPIGNARKCHFCLHLLEVNLLPACVSTCLGGATYFGDLNDGSSLVSELIATERASRLKEELGTRPKVYYLT